MGKLHWQTFGELNDSKAYNESLQDEFNGQGEEGTTQGSSILNATTPRRDFLKYLGFSTAAAAVAASCEMPIKKAIPFANKPEDVVPGISKYYATTYLNEGDAVSVLAKVRDGRPIKIEGNELSTIFKGGTSARVQASVLDLYDTSRLRFPTINKNEATFEAIDKELKSKLEAIGSGKIVILTPSLSSTSSAQVIAQFTQKYPGAKHVVYDSISYYGMLWANEISFGKKAIPSYNFDKADKIVSISADFLGTWLNPIEFTAQYAVGRRLNQKSPQLSKHFHFETVASLTGSNADERFLVRPSEIPHVVLGLYNAILGKDIAIDLPENTKKAIVEIARELLASKGKALVVTGSNDQNVQILVNAINSQLGAYGSTIDFSTTLNTKQFDETEFHKLVDEMQSGAVAAIFIHNANPAYSWVENDKFIEGLKKVPVSVSLSTKNDETTLLCNYVIPSNHYLESWGDVEVKTGQFSFAQPTIYPLFKTRQWQDSLLTLSGSIIEFTNFFKNHWVQKLGSESNFDTVLQSGVYNTATVSNAQPSFVPSASDSATSAVTGLKVGKDIELVLYQKVAIGSGEGVSNPWLQEMPDPITKATWDNYLIVSPQLAKSLLKIDLTNNGQADAYEVKPPKHVVEVKLNGKSVKLPALIIPGTHPNTVGIAVGYGRNKEFGKAAVSDSGGPLGQNVYQFATKGTTTTYYAEKVTLTDTGDLYEVALTQTHNVYDTKQGNRTEIMKELTLSEFRHNPNEILKEREEELEPYGGIEKFAEKGTIYPASIGERPGIKWGMNVDLNTCTGCGACVVACTAENNVSVVGKPEVLRGHEMHWLRIDRYYSGHDLENPKVVFQPLMCQHCDNAPCENVCPVAATNHSSEGLNQMTYNRCIGTRYCANNCPYKVRRFNWADYSGADSFADNQKGILNDVVLDMNDDLTRMVLNPDVTVRSRGVIEKCSFCVQRLQAAKLASKKESRPLKDTDIKVACQQACPTHAISFGNLNDKNSNVTESREVNDKRLFFSLEQLHVLPSVSYLAKVRNYEEKTQHHKEA